MAEMYHGYSVLRKAVHGSIYAVAAELSCERRDHDEAREFSEANFVVAAIMLVAAIGLLFITQCKSDCVVEASSLSTSAKAINSMMTEEEFIEATSIESASATTTYHRMTVDRVGVFYREAGPKDAPTILLLHGFPSSSREFDTLIPLIATRYHLIAPDFPGFGQSDAPPPSSYVYTFDNLAKTIPVSSSNARSTNTPSCFMIMAGQSAFA